jgi:hypothetical protein
MPFQHRKNHGLGSHRSTEIVHCIGKSVALNAQQDYVIGSGDAVSGNGFRMYRQISMWTDDLESFCVYLFRSLGANEKRDVAVRPRPSGRQNIPPTAPAPTTRIRIINLPLDLMRLGRGGVTGNHSGAPHDVEMSVRGARPHDVGSSRFVRGRQSGGFRIKRPQDHPM